MYDKSFAKYIWRKTWTLRLVVSTSIFFVASVAVFFLGQESALEVRDNAQQDDLPHPLDVVVNRLIRIQTRDVEAQSHHHSMVNSVVQKKFPWLMKRRSLPNFFLHLPQNATTALSYSRGVLVLVKVPKTGGELLQQCLVDVSRNWSRTFSTSMTDSLRLAWDNETLLTPGYRNAFDGHVGWHAFGMCEHVGRPCSYVALMRQPLERAVANYFYCQEALGDPMCTVLRANQVDIREWIIFQGSVFFRSLLFEPSVCESQRWSFGQSGSYRDRYATSEQAPCWYKQKLWLDQLSDSEHDVLLDYVLDRLDRWFAVVGVTEDLWTMVQMLQKVYRLPVTGCNALQRDAAGSKEKEFYADALRTNNARPQSHFPLSYDEYVDLQYDYSVQRALRADYKLYAKVKQIAHFQEQLYSNKLKS